MERNAKYHLSDGGVCLEHAPITDADRGEILCRMCGTVITDRIEDVRHDQYGDMSGSKNLHRTGPSISLTMHDKGLYTVIGSDSDSSGNRITDKNKFDRLRRWDKRTKSVSKTRNLGAAFTLLHGLKTKLAIPESVTEKAAYYYRKALDQKLIRGRSMAPMLLACLYAACRETHTPRSLEDLSLASNIRKTSLSRALRLMVRNMDLRLDQYDISAFMTRMANNLSLREKTKRDALLIIERSRGLNIIGGKNPVAFAAAALYMASLINGEPVTQSLMTSSSGISSVTIRNTAALIKKELQLEV